MSLAAAERVPTLSAQERLSVWLPSRTRLRWLLIAGCAASSIAALSIGDPASLLQADAELAVLLRGMAAIKAAIVIAAVAAVYWRFGQPPRLSAAYLGAYLAGAWVITGATLLIWQLSFIALAALIFHLGALALLLVAWRDDGARPQRLRKRITDIPFRQHSNEHHHHSAGR